MENDARDRIEFADPWVAFEHRFGVASRRRMPPVGEITEKTEEDSRSNRHPIELIGSPACQRSQISDR
jgi:hypothetical protein